MTPEGHPSHFYKYTSAHVGQLVLGNHRLRWNSPLNYNDPFDCHFPMGFNFHLAQYREQAIERVLGSILGEAEPVFATHTLMGVMMAGLRNIRHEVSHDEIRSEMTAGIDECIEKFNDGFASEAANWRAQLPTYRILCVCEAVDNLLLWSHYADQHKGVVFQLECLKELDVPLLLAKPVIYSPLAPSIATAEEWIDVLAGLRETKTAKEYFHELFHTKSILWQTEKEWRVSSFAKADEPGLFSDYPFHPPELSRMYLGCRISAVDRTQLIRLATSEFAHVEVYQAVQNERTYGLTFDRIR
jgi:hypothetical protein